MAKELSPTTPELLAAIGQRVTEILTRDAGDSFLAGNPNWFVCDYDPRTHPGLGDTFFAYENLKRPLFEGKIGKYQLPLTRGHVEKLSLGDTSKKEDSLFVHIVFAVEFKNTKFRILAKLDLIQERLEFSFRSGVTETLLEGKDARSAGPQLEEILNMLNGL